MLVLLERLPIQAEEYARGDVTLAGENDVYKWGTMCRGTTKVTVISPADHEHIRKYDKRGQRALVMLETKGLYESATKGWIMSQKRTKWVDNIIKGTSEVEKILFADEDICILPDFKWTDHSNIDQLYLLILFKDPESRSIRDLRREHLHRLGRARDAAKTLLQSRFSLGLDQVAVYFHYPPTYYRLHLHVVNLKAGMQDSYVAGKAHMLDSVMSNLALAPTYYAEASIPVLLTSEHPLCKLWTEAPKQ